MKRRRKRRGRGRLLPALSAALLLVLLGAAAAFGIYGMERGKAGGAFGDGGSALLASGAEQARRAGEKAILQAKEQEALADTGKTGEANGTETDVPEAVDPENAPRVRVVLDPGHGGPGVTDEQELGAIYRDTCEKLLTLVIAKAAGEELASYGNVEIFYTRESDKALTLKERAAYAKSVDADYLISLHLNASEEHNFFGSEVFVSAFDSYYACGKEIGESVLTRLEGLGFASKGVKTRLGSRGADYYGIIRECKALGIPALIIEHGYMDEDRDWGRMDDTEKLEALGRADGAGIAAALGLEKGRVRAELPEIGTEPPAASPVRPDTTEPDEAWYTLTRLDEERVSVALRASDKESRVMYYDYSLDGGETWQMELYGEEEEAVFQLELGAGGEQEPGQQGSPSSRAPFL